MLTAERSRVQIGSREVGDGAPVFIVFEAGPTHDGLETAKALISHAAASGAHAIKFQILDPDRLVADRKQPFSYEILVDRASGKTETVVEPLYDILARRALTGAEWRELKVFCDQQGLAFFATEAEQKRRLAICRSVFLSTPVRTGEQLHDADGQFRRLGYGVVKDQFEQAGTAKHWRNLSARHMVKSVDLIS